MTWITRSRAAVLAIIFAFITLVCVLQIIDPLFRTAQLDLTETKKFTLGHGTINTLRTLEEPITLKLFFSDRVSVQHPDIRAYGRQVKDLLRAYVAHSRGNLRLEILDPEPFSEDEDEAVALGVAPAQTERGEDLYFGLVATNTLDGRETIPYFTAEREPFLEYDITTLISKLSAATPQKVALMSSLPLAVGGPPDPAQQGRPLPLFLFSLLENNFDLVQLPEYADDIADDITLLVVVHPQVLSDKTLYAIDQFVLRGGRVMVFVDPLSELAGQMDMLSGGQGPKLPKASSLETLFAAWGVEYDPQTVLADLGQALQVRTGMPQHPVIDYPLWIGVQGDHLNKRDLVVGNMSLLQFATVGTLSQKAGATTQFTPLIQSSDNAMLTDADDIGNQFDPIEFLIDFKPTGETYSIAARVSGDAKTAFPDGPPKDEKEDSEASEDAEGAAEATDRGANPAAGADELAEGAADSGETEAGPPAPQGEHLAASQSPINVIVVADTDLWDDKFWVERQSLGGQDIGVPTAENGVFVQNAVENLLGSNDLISLRSRGRDNRPLTAVEDLRRQAEARFLSKQKALEDELAATEQRLSELRNRVQDSDGEQGGSMFSSEEAQEMERFKAEYVRLRGELREVSRDLRAEIETLQNVVRFSNIILVPLVLSVVALVLARLRARRRQRSRQIVTGRAQ